MCNKSYIAPAILHIIPTRSSFKNVLSMCSESNSFTSLVMFLCHASFLKPHTGDSALAALTHVRSCVQEVRVRSPEQTSSTLVSIPPG